MSEFQDEYSESLETDFRKLDGALLNDTVQLLAPSEPIRISADASVQDAITRMVDTHRAAVVIVDADGRLIGIFTERDALIRVQYLPLHRRYFPCAPITVLGCLADARFPSDRRLGSDF